MAQATGEWAPASWHEVLAHLPAHRGSRIVELTVNYRTPSEIMDLASRVLQAASPHMLPPESVRATGREWPEARFIDGPISVCERMPKPVIAAISGTCLAGAFELTLACDLRIAEDGDYQIGFPETNFGLCPGAGGTQRLPRTIGTPVALMHILMGVPVSPREAERRGLVHETVSGKALDRAMEIARHLSSFTPESLAYIKRLVRSATETPLAQGLLLERRLFMKLCLSDAALSRMRAYDEQDSASPSRLT